MSLHLFIGPMFSGKSTEMIRQIRRERIISPKLLVVSSKLDTRYSAEDYVINHDLDREPCLSVMKLAEITDEQIKGADTIFLEEAQFFEDLLEMVRQWVDKEKKKVIVFGLDGDSERRPFGQVLQLIPLCDSVTRLTSLCEICKDGTPGLFSKRLVADRTTIHVGSHEVYIPVCRKCFLDPDAGKIEEIA